MSRAERVRRHVRAELRSLSGRRHSLFFLLLLLQWFLAQMAALWWSPVAWAGRASNPGHHLEYAALVGGLLTFPPLVFLRVWPHAAITRHVVALAQMGWSALVIHLAGGRIEAHFHVFGSLAFLAFYRDPWVLLTGVAAVAADHLARGVLWPESLYGVAHPEWWRFLEHFFFVTFELGVLLLGTRESRRELRAVAERQVDLEDARRSVEDIVRRRTEELVVSREEYRLAAEKLEGQQRLERELVQAQRLQSVGRLAAGVAHEINTPIQFASDSVHFLRDAFADLLRVLDGNRALREAVERGEGVSEAAEAAREVEVATDVAFVVHNAPAAIERALEGLSRVATIVRSLKHFAQADRLEKQPIDLNQAVRSTLVVARNEYKYVAELETDLGDLPPVVCHAGDVNQSVLCLVVNAAEAIAGVVRGTEGKGRIVVRTRLVGTEAEIAVEDTGGGIPAALRGRVFEPFFTTKEVGKGAGQGLATTRAIVEKHGGTIHFESEAGRGTTFVIRLPVDGERRVAA